mgnify:CR=1 FL=1
MKDLNTLLNELEQQDMEAALNPGELDVQEGESDLEYRFRIYELRAQGKIRTWDEVARIINSHTDANHTESKYRREYKAGYPKADKDISDKVEADEEIEELVCDESDIDDIENVEESPFEKFMGSEERTLMNNQYRRINREKTCEEIAKYFANAMNSKKVLRTPTYDAPVKMSNKDAILVLSDWHYGVEFNTYWNTYSTQIARQRVSELVEKTKKICAEEGVQKIHIVNLQDLIAGRIHKQIQLQSRIDVISQIMEVTEILAEAIANLSDKRWQIHYYDSLDNHSRVEPNKTESMDLESLCRITTWALPMRLQKLDNEVIFHTNKYGMDIVTFMCRGHKVIGVHGDKDTPATVISKLSGLTSEHYDLILTAHLHHFSADEENETVRIGNGSLMGTDTYAVNLRLNSKPSQTLIIASDETVTEKIYKINLE